MTDKALESPAPTKAKRECQWCGSAFETAHHSKMYCSNKCKNDLGNFMAVIGKRIAADALLWRRTRGAKGSGSAAFQRICKLLDEGNEQFRNREKADGVKKLPTIDSYVAAANSAVGVRRGMDRR